MNTENNSAANAFDILKWVVVIALVTVGVVGNSYFSTESLLYRALALVALAVFAVALAFQTRKGAAFWGLIKESRTEIRKVVWPTTQETNQTTLIVIAGVFVTGFILWLIDLLLGWIISQLIG